MAMARIKTTTTLLLWMAVFIATSWAPTAALKNACFELPIVIISPTNERLPSASCIQNPLPSPNCMKKPIEAIVEVVDHAKDNTPNCFLDARTSAYLASVHYRGQSSLNFPKHQLGVTLSQPSELLGFPMDQEFVLNGPWIDSSLLRNHLAHWLFRQTTRYSPRTRHFVLFIRDHEDPMDFTPEYKGIYLALEKISYGPSRVALAPLDHTCNGSELSGGWAWQINPLDYGVYSPNLVRDKYETAFGSGERPVLMHPAREVLTQRMRDYFVDPATSPLTKMYAYLYENSTSQPDELGHHIDIGSFVDYFLHSEMSQNTDAYRRSTYFFKDRDEPINAGPVWDFNLAYGKGANQEDWLYKPFTLWKRLMCNYQFATLVQQRWRELRANLWSDAAIHKFVQESVAPINRQLDKCANWTSADLYCANVRVGGGAFAENVQALEVTVLSRAKWMDANIGKLYMATNASVCVPVGPEPPQYNCAKNTSDGGCLKDPEAYIRAVAFPAVRSPSNSTTCTGNGTLEMPSIDPCWLSVGASVVQSALTMFCSGYGYCEPGPGATCQCVQGHQPPTCAVAAAPGNPPPTTGQQGVATTLMAAAPLKQKSFVVSEYFSWGYIFAMACAVCGAMALYYHTTKFESVKENAGTTVAFASVPACYGTSAAMQVVAD